MATSRTAWAVALVLGGTTRVAAAEPKRDLAPEPLAVGARLTPCEVELEHTFRGDDDVTWRTRRVPVWSLVRRWDDARYDVDFMSNAVMAPIPMTVDQARVWLPEAREERYRTHFWIASSFGENDFAYHFDDRGRTVKVDWDPVADSSVYTFHYRYDCGIGAVDLRPFYADDLR